MSFIGYNAIDKVVDFENSVMVRRKTYNYTEMRYLQNTVYLS